MQRFPIFVQIIENTGLSNINALGDTNEEDIKVTKLSFTNC